MKSAEEKRRRFHQLHETGCFALPNPWDIGSALYLQHLGFKALATTSAGFAFSRGLPDGKVGRDAMLAHIRELAAATDLPLNADFENGYADSPEEVAENVRLCADTGVAGLSIEDNSGDKQNPLYSLDVATERIRAARSAADESSVLLVARAECFLVGREEIDEVIRRLTAYAEAGADCLYAPGVSEPAQIKAMVQAVAPKPVNLLIGSAGSLPMKETEALGVRRVSVGGAMARAAWGGFIAAAKGLAERGSFDQFAQATPHSELQNFFAHEIGS